MPDPTLRVFVHTDDITPRSFQDGGDRTQLRPWDKIQLPTSQPDLPSWVLQACSFEGDSGENHYDSEVYRAACRIGVEPYEREGRPVAIDILDEPYTTQQIIEAEDFSDAHGGNTPCLEDAVLAAVHAGIRVVLLPDRMASTYFRYYRLAEDFPDTHAPRDHDDGVIHSIQAGEGLTGQMGGAINVNSNAVSAQLVVDTELPMSFKCTSRGDLESRTVWALSSPDMPASARFWTDSFKDCATYPSTSYIPELAGVNTPEEAWKIICTYRDARLPSEKERFARYATIDLSRTEHIDI